MRRCEESIKQFYKVLYVKALSKVLTDLFYNLILVPNQHFILISLSLCTKITKTEINTNLKKDGKSQ